MNEEIKALIEREGIERRFEISQKGIEYFNEKKGIHNVMGVDPVWLSVFNDAYEIGHTDALSIFRWRKVEEELPPLDVYVLTKRKRKFDNKEYPALNKMYFEPKENKAIWECQLPDISTTIEWMPIPQ